MVAISEAQKISTILLQIAAKLISREIVYQLQTTGGCGDYLSSSQFKNSVSEVSKALVLCFIMIFTSLAKFNIIDISNNLELSEINVSQTSNLSIGQAIGEEWVLSFTEEEVGNKYSET